jgi:hypothetical protein
MNQSIFIFASDGSMKYKPQKMNKFTPSSGPWTFSGKNRLKITFTKGENHRHQTHYLGARKMTLMEEKHD